MGLGGSRFKLKKADGKNSSAFLCGLIWAGFYRSGELE
jgi:hypothetical protein